MRRRMRRELKVLLVADALLLFATEMFGPLYAVFVQQIGGDLLTAGWAYATFSMTGGVAILVLSRLTGDIRGREWLVPLGYFLSALGVAGYLFVRTPLHLFVVQALMGLALAVLTPPWDALFARSVDEDQAVFQWGLEEAQDYIVPAIAAGAGAVIADAFGFRTLFVVMFVAALMGALVSLLVMRRGQTLPPSD